MPMRNRTAMDLWRGGPGDVWNPLREFSRLQRDIDRLFDQVLSPTGAALPGPAGQELTTWSPQTDIEETDTHYLMSFDLPGVRSEDVRIELRDNQLIVSGERKEERKEEMRGRQLRERFYGTFQRVFTLPANIDQDQIEATYDNGVLYLAVPKAEAAKPKAIQIGEKKGGILGKLLGKGEKKEEKAA